MAVRLGESLIALQKYSGDDIFARYMSDSMCLLYWCSFRQWIEAEPGEDRAFDTGMTIMEVHRFVSDGLHPKQAAQKVLERTGGTRA